MRGAADTKCVAEALDRPVLFRSQPRLPTRCPRELFFGFHNGGHSVADFFPGLGSVLTRRGSDELDSAVSQFSLTKQAPQPLLWG